MCAPFTSMEFLVRALGTYKSPLSFDRVVLVEMFEIGVNNAHTSDANPFTALYTNCDCLYLTRSGSGSQFVSTVDHLETGIQSLLLLWQHVFGVCTCDLMLLQCPRLCCSSPCGVACSSRGTFSLLCMEGIVLSCTEVRVFLQSYLYILYMDLQGEEIINMKPK